ncbi:MAG: YciI family protein [Pseudomonadota bacterium]
MQDAQDWAANDPYAKAGLFEHVEVVAYKWLRGEGK